MTCLFLSLICPILIVETKGKEAILIEIRITVVPGLPNPEVEIRTAEITPEVERIQSLLEKENTFILTTKSGIECVDRESIALVRTEVGKVIVYMDDGEWYEVRSTLAELEERLGNGFARISKSVIINIRAVKRVRASFSGTLDVELKNGNEEVISRNYRKSFKSKLGV